ncbi:unnamed protein product [Mesocestoides corti]|uniref:Kinesin motor domain-containing protein n=3 Tax=Mesocestoides corti TaxID=53468 RepID=A0A0R3UPH7_MESCO|nr:unnamed protein product [Mesocestoides corti]
MPVGSNNKLVRFEPGFLKSEDEEQPMDPEPIQSGEVKTQTQAPLDAPRVDEDLVCENKVAEISGDLNENNANSVTQMVAGCAPFQRNFDAVTDSSSIERLMTSDDNGQQAEILRLVEINKELSAQYGTLQAQFSDLLNEHNRLQYRHNMLELATMQNSQGDGSNRARSGDDLLLVSQYREDLRKLTAEKESLCQQAAQQRDEFRQTATRLSFLQSYVSQLQNRVAQRDLVIQKLIQERALNMVRDVHSRMLHNELMELRGGIRVIIRYLPTSEEFSNIEIINSNIISIRKPLFNFMHLRSKPQGENLSVYNIHNSEASNSTVFADVRDYVEACVDGHTAAIIANGPKGTGKTHTMIGPADDAGIIPRALSLISRSCRDRSPLWEYKISLSAIQASGCFFCHVYNNIVEEEIYDLLGDTDEYMELKKCWFPSSENTDGLSKITLHDNGSSIILKNVTELEQNTEEELMETFCKAWQVYSKSSHAEVAHFIVLVRIKAYGKVPLTTTAFASSSNAQAKPQQVVSHGFLILCDLVSFDRGKTRKPGVSGSNQNERFGRNHRHHQNA